MMVAEISHLFPSLGEWAAWAVIPSILMGVIMKFDFKAGVVTLLLTGIVSTYCVIIPDEDISNALNNERGYQYALVVSCMFNAILIIFGLFTYMLLQRIFQSADGEEA